MMNQERIERKAKNEHHTIYQMYCSNVVCDRLRRLNDKLAEKNLMFKFDGNKYAVFVLDINKRTQITDYILNLEQVEDFAENA